MADAEKESTTPYGYLTGAPWRAKPFTAVWWYWGVTATVYFRKDYGERYLGPIALAKGVLWLSLYLIGMRFYAGHWKFLYAAPVPAHAWISWSIFTGLYILYVSWQIFRGFSRKRSFSDEFSFSDGRPHPFLFTLLPFIDDAWDFERIYEPILVLMTGATLAYFGNWMGPFVLVAGCLAFISANGKYKSRRGMDLDRLDGFNQYEDLIGGPEIDRRRGGSTPIKPFSDKET